jgi:hypothetical protein
MVVYKRCWRPAQKFLTRICGVIAERFYGYQFGGLSARSRKVPVCDVGQNHFIMDSGACFVWVPGARPVPVIEENIGHGMVPPLKDLEGLRLI